MRASRVLQRSADNSLRPCEVRASHGEDDILVWRRGSLYPNRIAVRMGPASAATLSQSVDRLPGLQPWKLDAGYRGHMVDDRADCVSPADRVVLLATLGSAAWRRIG